LRNGLLGVRFRKTSIFMKEATCVYLIKPGFVLMADQQAKIVGTKGYGGKIKSGQTII